MVDIAIIGAGASGLVAAISATRNGCQKILIIEKNPKVGKKILSTGNGRCNLSNTDINKDKYNGDKIFLDYIKNCEDSVSFFESLGIITKTDECGRIYPYSNTASSVLDALRFAIDNPSIEINCDFNVKEINTDKKIFIITGENGKKIKAKKIIIATGGKSTPSSGSNGSGFDFAKNLGHRVISPVPSLCPIKTNSNYLKSLKGIRVSCKSSLYIKNKIIKSEIGEIQFNENTLSGICVFNLSSYVPQNYENALIKIDLAPDIEYCDLEKHITNFKEIRKELPVEDLLTGILNKRLGQQLIKLCTEKSLNTTCKEITHTEIKKISNKIKNLEFDVTGLTSWEQSQVTKGGIPADEIFDNFESKIKKGLFFCGEILNICGDCGGYNLDFAWKSGYAAGKSAAISLKGN